MKFVGGWSRGLRSRSQLTMFHSHDDKQVLIVHFTDLEKTFPSLFSAASLNGSYF